MVQEIFFCGEDDGQKFLFHLERVFPNMKALFWDWNMVDPQIEFNLQSKTCLDIIANLYRYFFN